MCWNCGETGHKRDACPKPWRGRSRGSRGRSRSGDGRSHRRRRNLRQRRDRNARGRASLENDAREQMARNQGEVDALREVIDAQREEIRELHGARVLAIDRVRRLDDFAYAVPFYVDEYRHLLAGLESMRVNLRYIKAARVASGVLTGALASVATAHLLDSCFGYSSSKSLFAIVGGVAGGFVATRMKTPITVSVEFGPVEQGELPDEEVRVLEQRYGDADVGASLQTAHVTFSISGTVVSRDVMTVSAAALVACEPALARAQTIERALAAAEHRISAVTSVALGARVENEDTVRRNTAIVATLRWLRHVQYAASHILRNPRLN